MNAVAHDILREYAGRRWPSMNHKGRISRLAGHLGLGHRRVRSLYQNEPGVRMRADEAEIIKALKGQTQDAVEDRDFAERLRALEEQISALRSEMAGAQVEGQSATTARPFRGQEGRSSGSVGRRSGNGAR